MGKHSVPGAGSRPWLVPLVAMLALAAGVAGDRLLPTRREGARARPALPGSAPAPAAARDVAPRAGEIAAVAPGDRAHVARVVLNSARERVAAGDSAGALASYATVERLGIDAYFVDDAMYEYMNILAARADARAAAVAGDILRRFPASEFANSRTRQVAAAGSR